MKDRNEFIQYSTQAREVLRLAQKEAVRSNHGLIDSEHLLLGLVQEGEGVAALVLRSLGVDLPTLRRTLESSFERRDPLPGRPHLGMTPAAQRVIHLASKEVFHLHQHYLGTEHLLVGLIQEDEGQAASALQSLGLTLEQVRSATLQELRQETPAETFASNLPLAPEALWSVPSPKQNRFESYVITSAAPEKTPIGKKERATVMATMLGRVQVLTGGAFTLTLYEGMADDAPIVAVIDHPPSDASFHPFNVLEQGLAYTLIGEPGSVSVEYVDIPKVFRFEVKDFAD